MLLLFLDDQDSVKYNLIKWTTIERDHHHHHHHSKWQNTNWLTLTSAAWRSILVWPGLSVFASSVITTCLLGTSPVMLLIAFHTRIHSWTLWKILLFWTFYTFVFLSVTSLAAPADLRCNIEMTGYIFPNNLPFVRRFSFVLFLVLDAAITFIQSALAIKERYSKKMFCPYWPDMIQMLMLWWLRWSFNTARAILHSLIPTRTTIAIVFLSCLEYRSPALRGLTVPSSERKSNSFSCYSESLLYCNIIWICALGSLV